MNEAPRFGKRGNWPAVSDDAAMRNVAGAHARLGDVFLELQYAGPPDSFNRVQTVVDSYSLILNLIACMAQSMDHHGLLWPTPDPKPPTWRDRWRHRITRTRQRGIRR